MSEAKQKQMSEAKHLSEQQPGIEEPKEKDSIETQLHSVVQEKSGLEAKLTNVLDEKIHHTAERGIVTHKKLRDTEKNFRCFCRR